MEQFNYILNAIIGTVVVPLVTELVKKWWGVASPAISFSLVILLSLGVALGLKFLYIPEALITEVLASALIIALTSIGAKVAHKQVKKL